VYLFGNVARNSTRMQPNSLAKLRQYDSISRATGVPQNRGDTEGIIMKKTVCVLVAAGIVLPIIVLLVVTRAAGAYTLIHLPGGHCSSGDLVHFRISHLSGRYVCLAHNY
jgi:hypothetical protein